MNKGHKFPYEYDKYDGFMEFEIDGENLHRFLRDKKDRVLMDHVVGLLGLLSRSYDELIIRYLLKKEISKSDIISAFARYGDDIEESSVVSRVHMEFNREYVMLYGCRACLDCHSLGPSVGKHQHHYTWHFKWGATLIFKKEEYERELLAYLSKIRNHSFTLEESIGLYQF